MRYPEDREAGFENLSGVRETRDGDKFSFDGEGRLEDVVMIFVTENDEYVIWLPSDCPDSGTPIDDETGEDLEYVGLAWDVF